jgi:hypothetical protein
MVIQRDSTGAGKHIIVSPPPPPPRFNCASEAALIALV